VPSPVDAGGGILSGDDEKLQRLLDGEIDESEIAADPVLSSLAERIFGLTIEPITPSKPSQMQDLSVEGGSTGEKSLLTMIEVVPGAAPVPAPLPEIVPKTKSVKKSRKGMKIFSTLSLTIAAANVFGAFGFLNSNCNAVKCTADATRINWIDIHNIGNEMGWSMPFPTFGIPDYIALGASILLMIIAFLRK
jgi:hypothetical protein